MFHIGLILGDVERNRNGKENGDRQPLLEEIIEIIHSNRTAVAKALAFLDIDARENRELDGQGIEHEDFERQMEFESEGSVTGTMP